MIVERVQIAIFLRSSAIIFSASNGRRPTLELPVLSLFWLSTSKLPSLPAYSLWPLLIHSLFRIRYSLSSVISPLISVLRHLSSGIRRLSSETFPIKAPFKLLTLHVVASFGSPSRCCKVVRPDEGQVFFCNFVWLKMLDKPNIG